MQKLIYHILIPAFAPIIFYRIVITPVEILGCRTRGLLAFSTALLSGLAALAIAFIQVRRKARGDSGSIKDTAWWTATILILAIPVIALLVLA